MTSTRSSNSSSINPAQNFYHLILAFTKNRWNYPKILEEILKLPKDTHGNILIGLDNRDFTIWKNYLKFFVSTKIFGPLFIPTYPSVIRNILSHLKIDESNYFVGNRSVDVVQQLTGNNNIFSAKNSETHALHKSKFKNYLLDIEKNIEIVSPFIKKWVFYHVTNEINDSNIEKLTAEIMCAFLLNKTSAHKEDIITSVIIAKSHFNNKATFKSTIADGYQQSKKHIFHEITQLYNDSSNDSYPNFLKKNNFSLDEIKQHILSLFMVGFANLQSSISSLLLCLAQNPDLFARLKPEIKKIQNISFLNFDLDQTKANNYSYSQKFFMESLRLTPPVFVQARKSGNTELQIAYRDENNHEKTFMLPSNTLILIPNLALARQADHGNDFIPERENSSFHPFSTGPNACPGRKIVFATTGILAAEIINSKKILQLTSNPTEDYQVSLKWKDIHIKFVEQKQIIHSQKNNCQKFGLFALATGMITAGISYYASNVYSN